jgi:signal transduction histidine kinase
MVSEAPVDRRIHRLGEEYLGGRDIDGVVPEPEGREPYEDGMRVIDTGKSILGNEGYYPSVDRWFRTSKVPWTDEHGEVSGLVGIAQEVTARKDRERQLEITHHVVRHTLRNKLNVILGRCNRIMEGGSVAGNVERIAEAAAALADTVDNQQTILEMMIGEPEATPTNLSRVVCHRVELAEARAPEAAIELRAADALATANAGGAVAFERTGAGGNEVALTFPVADAAGEPTDRAAES